MAESEFEVNKGEANEGDAACLGEDRLRSVAGNSAGIGDNHLIILMRFLQMNEEAVFPFATTCKNVMEVPDATSLILRLCWSVGNQLTLSSWIPDGMIEFVMSCNAAGI